jgi:hypothetical protein
MSWSFSLMKVNITALFFQVSRLNYDWNTGAKTYLPILLTSYKTPGRETVTVTVSNSINSKNFTVSFVVNGLLFLSEKSEL